MSNEEKDTFGKYLPNYKINLVDAKKLAKENCLNSDLQYVLGMLEYKKEKEKQLKEYQKKEEISVKESRDQPINGTLN